MLIGENLKKKLFYFFRKFKKSYFIFFELSPFADLDFENL